MRSLKTWAFMLMAVAALVSLPSQATADETCGNYCSEGCGARIGGVCIWSIWEGSGSACDEGGCDAFCTGCGATYGLCQTTQCAGITYGYCACITQY